MSTAQRKAVIGVFVVGNSITVALEEKSNCTLAEIILGLELCKKQLLEGRLREGQRAEIPGMLRPDGSRAK